MAKFTYYYNLITLIVFTMFAVSDAKAFLSLSYIFKSLPELPSSSDFLSQLLNITTNKITSYAATRTFYKPGLSANDVKISFYQNDGTITLYRLGNGDIPLNFSQDIKILIHGYKSNGTVNWAEKMSKSYHKIGMSNILGIDWTTVANQAYITSATSSKRLGRLIATWLFYKVLQGNSSLLKKVHLIGHSLGAHISGFVGKSVSKITNGQNLIGKISGLDAAAPLFEYPVKLPISLRLIKGDADTVEGYHTNKGFFGFASEYGHRDFYISSGGPVQPGCIKSFNIIDLFICSHLLAQDIFIKTIESQSYLATKCKGGVIQSKNLCVDDKIIMGEHTNATDQTGSYFIDIDENLNSIG